MVRMRSLKTKLIIKKFRFVCVACIAGRKDGKLPENYWVRNKYMVDRADVLTAVYDDECFIRSGTGMIVNYAKKEGLLIILIYFDTGTILRF